MFVPHVRNRVMALPQRVRLLVAGVLGVVLAATGLVLMPAGADPVSAGAMTVGATTTVTSTAAGEVYRYTLSVPAGARTALRTQPSDSPSRVNVGVFANDYGDGLVAGDDLGNGSGDTTLLTVEPMEAQRTFFVEVTVRVPGVLPIAVGTISDIGPLPLAFGTDTTVTLTEPGQEATYTFAGVPGHRLGPTVVSSFPSSANLRVTLSGPGINTTRLFTGGSTVPGWVMEDGTYTLRVYTLSHATGSLTLRVDDVQDVTTPTAFDTEQTVTVSTVWTHVARPFTRVPGAYLRVDVLSADLKGDDGTPGTAELSVRPEAAGTLGGTITSSSTTQTFVSPYPMNDAETGTLAIEPGTGVTGTITYRLTAVPENAVQPLKLGATVPVDLSPLGTTRSYSLDLVEGQRYEVQVSDLTLTGDSTYLPRLSVQLRDPSRNTVEDVGNAVPGKTFTEIVTPDRSGKYVLQLDPSDTRVGSATLRVRSVSPRTVPLAVGGTATGSFDASPGVLFAVPGRADGARPSLVVRSVSLTRESGTAQAGLDFVQDGQSVGSSEVLTSPAAAGRTFAVPAQLDLTRAWQVRVTATEGVSGSVTLGLREPVRTTRTVALGATTRVTFAAFGDTTELTFTPHADRRIVVRRTGAAAALQLKASDGTAVEPVFQENGWTEYPLTTSATAMTLVVGLDPQDPRTGTLTVAVREVKDPVLAAGHPVRATFSAAQNPRIVVDGHKGERITLGLSATSWTPADQPVIVSLITPTGTMRLGPVRPGESPFLDAGLGLLPADGRYTVELDPQGRAAGSVVVDARLVRDPPQQTAQLGVPVRVVLRQPGQVAHLKLSLPSLTSQVSWSGSVTGGLTGRLDLSGPGGNFVHAVISPAGTFTSPPLVAGDYDVIIDPDGRSTGTVTLTFTAVAAG
jgi:hypothetical protein